MPKDRENLFWLAAGTRILYRRSSRHPYEYAIMLQVHNGEGWETVVSADNAHEGERRDTSVDDHHCHRYAGGSKQAPEALPYRVADTNEAMNKAIRWFADDWEALTS